MSRLSPPGWDALVPVLEEARRLGLLGPGPVEAHLEHAAGFADAVGRAGPPGGTWQPRRAADLGSGAGLPGLPLALCFPECRWTLVEAGLRRAAFLNQAASALHIDARVEVVAERAESVGRRAEARSRFDLVVARSFGPPAVVAECGAPLLAVGGRLVVSEPPGGAPARWPVEELQVLGLAPGPAISAGGAAFQVLIQTAPCPDRFPRRVGVPTKRPLF